MWIRLASTSRACIYGEVEDVAIVEERERLAREMHHGIAQLLGHINTQTLAVKKLLSNAEVSTALKELDGVENVARGLYTDVREGILGLRSPSSPNQRIVPVLRE